MSLWSLIRGRIDRLDHAQVQQILNENRQNLEERSALARKLAFGVEYQWQITDITAEHFFQGASPAELEQLEADPEMHMCGLRIGVFTYSFPSRRPTWTACTSYPDAFFPNSGLPTTDEMIGTYDIIYYAGSFCGHERKVGSLVHYQTARGTLNLNSARGVLEGSITMDPRMETLDVIPFGGNSAFRETGRIQSCKNQWPQKLKPANGIISITVIQPPDGLVTHNSDGERIDFQGEIRIFKQKTPTGLSLGGESFVVFENLEEAENLMENYRSTTCSWLHNHTGLPAEVTRLIGEFRCPPPVFFFEEGDLCLDFNWSNHMYINPELHCVSSVIARRRNPITQA